MPIYLQIRHQLSPPTPGKAANTGRPVYVEEEHGMNEMQRLRAPQINVCEKWMANICSTCTKKTASIKAKLTEEVLQLEVL